MAKRIERNEEGNVISDPSTVAKIINSFLNEMEIALIKDVQELKTQKKISDDVYNAFISRNMQELDELYQKDLEKYRNEEIVTAASIQRGTATKALPDWKGEHFKVKLKNRDFVHSNKIAKQTPPVLLLGSPGIGKSDIVRSIANSRGYGPAGLLDIRLSQKEAIDLRGFPVPNKNTKSVDWFISSEWPRNPLSRGILFLDELTSAPKSVQVGAYELILDRKLGDVDTGGYELPPGWFICSAGNLASDGAAVEEVSSALANRLLHIVMHVNVENWLDWALKSNIHPCVISFMTLDSVMGGLPATYKLHNMNQSSKKASGVEVPVVNLQQGWPSPRSWARISTVLYSYEAMLGYESKIRSGFDLANKYSNFKDIVDPVLNDPKKHFITPEYLKNNLMNASALKDMIIGLIGYETGREFYTFYEEYANAIQTITSILIQKPLNSDSKITIFTDNGSKQMATSKLVDAIKLLVNPATSSDQRDRLRDEIGANPLVYLQASPDVLQSKKFFKDSLSGLDGNQLVNAYSQGIKNILTFIELLTSGSPSQPTNIQNVKLLLVTEFNKMQAGVKKSSLPDEIKISRALSDACLANRDAIDKVLQDRGAIANKVYEASVNSRSSGTSGGTNASSIMASKGVGKQEGTVNIPENTGNKSANKTANAPSKASNAKTKSGRKNEESHESDDFDF